MTPMIMPSTLLRRALQADTVFSGGGAMIFSLAASELAPLFNLPEALLLETGLFLIAYAALVGWMSTRHALPRVLAGIVVVGNALWTLASFALLFSGAVSPNLLGAAVVAAQAIATGTLAELQFVGLRRSGGIVAA
jgi:hypothetical protein